MVIHDSYIYLNDKLLLLFFQFVFDLIFVVGLLIAVAYFTLLERKLMASVQRRVGPNVVGFYGILQPLVDGVKLLNKEVVVPQRSGVVLFLLSPVIVFFLSIMVWSLLPFSLSSVIVDVDLSLLLLFLLSSLNVYGLIIAGWSSNSKYAFLGALRSGAQVISYELVFGFIIITIGLIGQSYSLIDLVVFQYECTWFIFTMFPIFVVFLVVMLAETNRAPFDLAEAEAEIVAGYNVEYSSIMFAMFFLGEYANMLMMSFISSTLFVGGFGYSCYFSLLVKVSGFLIFFVVVRAALPRYRYDQLMSLCWRILLPFCLSFVILLSSLSVYLC